MLFGVLPGVNCVMGNQEISLQVTSVFVKMSTKMQLPRRACENYFYILVGHSTLVLSDLCHPDWSKSVGFFMCKIELCCFEALSQSPFTIQMGFMPGLFTAII